MIKKLCVFITLIALSLSTFAAYITNLPITVTQPDGKTIECFASGDEYYNWLHDTNNFTIIQNSETGYYCYAILQDDKVVASSYIVGTVNPESVGIKAGVSISASEKKARRDAFWKVPDVTQNKNYKTPTGPRNVGEMNNLVVYIRFSDQTEFTEDTSYYWDMFNQTAYPEEQSMKNFFQQVSYNQLDLSTYFFPFTFQSTVISYQDSHPRGYYMPYSASNPIGYNENNDDRAEREFQLLTDATAYIADQVPVDLNIDYNNDGNVDNVCFIIKGGVTAWATLLWPHRWVLYGQEAYIHGKRVWDFNFQLSDYLVTSQSSVLCHEMFHSLGAPDLYRYNDGTITPVGAWDVMASNTNPAQSMSAYMKYKYGGWIDEIPEITEGGVYTINTPWVQENCIYKIASPNSTTEYFTVEYRNRSHHIFDNGIPGSGLLIYRINPSLDGNADGPPDEVYIFRPGGINTTTNGSVSSAYFSQESGRTEFNDETNPPCFLSDNSPGGIIIRNISALGQQMSFEVILGTIPEGDFTASQEVVTTNCEVDFYGISFYTIDQWYWEFEDGIPATSNEQNPTGIIFTSNGEKTVSLTVTNTNGSTTTTKQGFITVSGSILPIIDFYTSNVAICPNTPVNLIDNSSACPSSWQWSFSPNSVTFLEGTTAFIPNPIVQFNDYTSYSVTLTASNVNGSTTLTKENYITTQGLNPTDCSVNFSNISSFEEIGWRIDKEEGGNLDWNLYTFENSQKAARMNFFGNTQLLKKYYLILPVMNFDAPYELEFSHAYSLASNNYSDSLYISVSTDCGETWERIAGFGEDLNYSFATAPKQTTSFIPNENQWCGNTITNTPCNSVDLRAYEGAGTIMLRFEAVKVTGNNLYISDVTFRNTTAINEINDEYQISIFPNPSTGNFNLKCNDIQGKIDVKVYNSIGKLVLNKPSSETNTTLDLKNQPNGIYFVEVVSKEFAKTLKIIKL